MRPIDGAEAVLEEVGVLAIHTRDAMLARLVAVGQEDVAGVEARINDVADDSVEVPGVRGSRITAHFIIVSPDRLKRS
jgi:hypothetical protein